MFKKFSEKAGFTQIEIKVIFFLLIILLIGGVAKTVTQSKENFDYKNFSYTKDDSLFISESQGNESIKAFETSDSLNKSKVLDFKNQSFFNAERKAIPKEKSVNLNKSGVEELTKIPGIGKIIAKNIIELRNQRGKFLTLEELLDVKRIGDKKFNKIKRYFYIE
ncbi:MAG TPA: helix-hairpin-helix domain-containing protein [Ignavibacteriaceae bacterium]|nr:helix-hairpin-helix domain-containing protein [Ignavibacteriaceae bacterium]